MTKTEKYQLTFQKQAISNGFYYFVTSKTISHNGIARHLTYSNIINSNAQISELGDALAGQPIQEDWGEVSG